MLKKFLIVIAVLMINLSLAITCQAAKKVVAVMPLENVSGYDELRVAEIMTENLMVALQNSGSYIVSERAQAGTILREQGFQNLTSSSPVEMGEMTGASYSVIGKVTMAAITANPTGMLIEHFIEKLDNGNNSILAQAGAYVHHVKAKVAMNVRFVDNRTGEVVFAKTFEGSKSGQNPEIALNEACKVVAMNFLQELQGMNTFAARIAEISGSDIYIDGGSDIGIGQGEILTVVRETSPIVINGQIVGMKSDAVGKVIVVAVNSNYSICRAESGASSIQKGDVVKRG